MDIKRSIPDDELACWRCDYFKFKSRPEGHWAFCVINFAWLPAHEKAGSFFCDNLAIDGRAILKVNP